MSLNFRTHFHPSNVDFSYFRPFLGLGSLNFLCIKWSHNALFLKGFEREIKIGSKLSSPCEYEKIQFVENIIFGAFHSLRLHQNIVIKGGGVQQIF